MRRERRSKDRSVICRKNQVTLPIQALKAAGLARRRRSCSGGRSGRLEIVRVDALVDEFAGVLDAVLSPEGYLDELRSEQPQSFSTRTF